MDASQLPRVSLLTALRWPVRARDILTLFPERPASSMLDQALWLAISACIEHGIPDSIDHFHERVLLDVSARSPDFADLTLRYLQAVRSRDDLDEGHCMQMLRDHYAARAMQQMAAVRSEADADTLIRQFTLNRNIGRTRTARKVDLFANGGAGLLRPTPYIPIGCHVVDAIFGGLPPVGTLTLWVMPRKAGKTMLSLQTSKGCLNSGLKVLYMNFEQRALGDLANRLYGAMSNTQFTLFKTLNSLDEAPADVLERIRAQQSLWDENFVMLDAEELSTPGLFSRGMDSLRELIESFGIHFDLIIIDWWQRLWDRFKANMPHLARSEAQARQAESEEFQAIKNLAGDLNTRIFVFQQLRAALAGSAYNIGKLSTADAAENKSLAFLADAGVVSTTKNADHLVSFKLDFDRNGNDGVYITARMLALYQQFVPHINTDDQQALAVRSNPGEEPDEA